MSHRRRQKRGKRSRVAGFHWSGGPGGGGGLWTLEQGKAGDLLWSIFAFIHETYCEGSYRHSGKPRCITRFRYYTISHDGSGVEISGDSGSLRAAKGEVERRIRANLVQWLFPNRARRAMSYITNCTCHPGPPYRWESTKPTMCSDRAHGFSMIERWRRERGALPCFSWGGPACQSATLWLAYLIQRCETMKELSLEHEPRFSREWLGHPLDCRFQSQCESAVSYTSVFYP